MNFPARLATTILLSLAVGASALAVVELKHRSRVHMAELEQLDAEAAELRTERAQLELEESAWATHGRIEQVARERLEMSEPDVYSIVVVRP